MGKRHVSKGPAKQKNTDANPLGYRYLAEGPVRSRPTPLADIMPSILAKYGLTRRLATERFLETWEEIRLLLNAEAGLELSDDELRPTSFRSGVLSFEVNGGALLQEMTFYQEEFLRRFREAMPTENIKKIRFVLK